jgi:hypothetical protein
MEKPSGEFFETLGQYVYKYVDEEGDVLYIGKGNGDRCLSHLKSKKYKIENCSIVARNLERFENKKDWQSFLLESFLIATESPEHNSVSGHYKECFVMASLSSLFSDFESEQYDNFEVLPQWYIENYDTFKNRIREIKINSTTTYFLSNARNAIYMMWYWSPNEEQVKVTFEINQDKERMIETKRKLIGLLEKKGYETFSDGKEAKVAINVDSIHTVIELFADFWK